MDQCWLQDIFGKLLILASHSEPSHPHRRTLTHNAQMPLHVAISSESKHGTDEVHANDTGRERIKVLIHLNFSCTLRIPDLHTLTVIYLWSPPSQCERHALGARGADFKSLQSQTVELPPYPSSGTWYLGFRT
jgi:hypothetical protein